MQVNDQVASIETRVETLIKESQIIFLNKPTSFGTMQTIVQKDIEARQAVQKLKQSFKNYVSRVKQEVPSFKVTVEA